MPAKVGLCGKPVCPRICTRVCHCEAGLALGRVLLAQQAVRRYERQRLQAVVAQFEANVLAAAGPFQKFQRQLAWERQTKGEV